jgi:hypothetical protein
MQENDNSEILKNNSSVRVTATAALYKDIKMDNFNLNSLRIVIVLNRRHHHHHHHGRVIMNFI